MALAKTIEMVLDHACYTPIITHTAEDGVHLAQVERPDLILLDVMVPSMGGWDACKKIREFFDKPILFLTALGDVENIVHGLDVGADDYIVKPFDQAELVARVKAHLRRVQTTSSSSQVYEFGDGTLIVDVATRTVTLNDALVDLTPREFELMTVLVMNAGRTVATADLVLKAWGLSDHSAVDNIKPYIHYLRKKIESDPATPRWILTVRGIGYRFASR